MNVRQTLQKLGAMAILMLPGVVVSQVIPIFTNHFRLDPTPGLQGTYYDNVDFSGRRSVTRLDSAINFDFGAGSPDATFAPDTFSVRWYGWVAPRFTENYTFYSQTDDGVRVYIDGALIIDSFINQAVTEHASTPVPLVAGRLYKIRVDYFENTGNAVARLLWSSSSELKKVVAFQVGPDGSYSNFGEALATLPNGRFAVGAPLVDLQLGSPSTPFETRIYANDAGTVSLLGPAGDVVGAATGPADATGARFGVSLASFPDGRFLVGSMATAVSGLTFVPDVGRVQLQGVDGSLLLSWPNPDGPNNPRSLFGWSLATLPGNRFAAGSKAGFGRVFLLDAAAVTPPLITITNPTPVPGEEFGRSIIALGTNRILISDPLDSVNGDQGGSVFLYDLQGNRLRTIHNFTGKPERFGWRVAAVDDRRFLVSAPFTAQTIVANGQVTTNPIAGAVHLFDDSGTLLRTFLPPDLARTRFFGQSLAMLGTDRMLVGAHQEQIGTIPQAGRVHLFNLDGVSLAAIDNPEPGAGDFFGWALAALDDHRFVVSASRDGIVRAAAGSVYGFDAPKGTIDVGAEFPRPAQGLDVSGVFQAQGPAVEPAGMAYWHVPSQKLFSVRPGRVLVTWPLLNNQKSNVEAVADWPTNLNRFQLHVAGPTAIDLSGNGAFTDAVLHASTTDADTNAVSESRMFKAGRPGYSLIMVSAGSPAENPIRFQWVRTIEWNDPAILHDGVPAVIGEPIVDPGPYHDPRCGGPQVILPAAVFAPMPVYEATTRTGTIIPVNRDHPERPGDDPVVAFFQRGTKLVDPVTGQSVSNEICWPYQPVRYRPEWPANAPHLIIASQLGTGPLDPVRYVDWQLYFQNDPAAPGFNPNDEHALRRPLGGAEGVFALRDDLGTVSGSEPFVLVHYRDPNAGGAHRMKLWKVVAEEDPFFFRYPARAGQLIQPPLPLNSLPLAEKSVGVSGPFFRDRKLFFWARAAGDDGGGARIVMRYFYPSQPGFFFPEGSPPLGTEIPLLDLRAGTPGVPISIHFDATWPSEVPELRVGETLVKPKHGLPQIAGQSSVEVLYQQSLALGGPASVGLIDPVRRREVPLERLPAEITTRVKAGVRFLTSLPPHLENRVSFDPIARRLRLAGEFVEPPAGESYLLLNVLTPRDRAILDALSTDAVWRTAVGILGIQATAPIPVPADSKGFDSLALTAGNAAGLGYVTLAFGNSTNLSPPAEPVSLSILKVTCPPYRGELKVLESSNPLSEQLTLRHSGDFAGRAEDFEFEWRTLPPVDGLPSPLPPEQWVRVQPVPASGIGAIDLTISGPGLFTLSDNFFIVRYRPVNKGGPCDSVFSEWTSPMLAEGWIKRVLAGIGPFEQRIKDYQDTQVNTIVSMISQAGPRSVGDVALNLDAVDQAGLIEFYETVLRRGMALSIDGAPPVDYPPANDALLLAAGRLSDLYMLLGNEAYADAADPTVAVGTEHPTLGSQATSLHCFMNQTSSLLEEELALLRGRDDSKLPGVQAHPIYNRLIWNFTRDITGGEVAYALNYNIREADGDVAGTINEADARRLYPQGHGDAWGHYLTAIKNYYRLLRNPSFTWVPRIESVIVGGVPVSVDFLDERKFAATAAARARTGAEIVNLTYRAGYAEAAETPWQTQPDTVPERAWGLGEWASRAGQGALLDWVVANAILPDVDSNPSHTGIQRIDRTTITELREIAEQFRQIQDQSDQADSGLNPLGLASNVVPFDIDPGALASGRTHFEQVNDRANEALRNAAAVFDHANATTQLLRRQADETADFQKLVQNQETDFNNRLIEIFGTPYADDIGPAGTYRTGYTGPDIYHFDYVDDPDVPAGGATATQPRRVLTFTDLDVGPNGSLIRSDRSVLFTFSPNGFGIEKPSTFRGQRSALGEIQLSRGALGEAVRRFERGIAEYEALIDNIEDVSRSLKAEAALNAAQIQVRKDHLRSIGDLDFEIQSMREVGFRLRTAVDSARILGDFVAEAIPEVVGLASDAFSVHRAALKLEVRSGLLGAETLIRMNEKDIADRQDSKNHLAGLTDLKLFTLQTAFAQKERLRQLEQMARTEPALRLELAALEQVVAQAGGRYQSALARGLRLLEERTRFRQQTAAQIQTFRFKDMAFRVFRSDALQKYRAQFDLAARYAYLAARAYDFETCLAPGDPRGPGSSFLSSIIRSRSLGRFSNGIPQPGGGTGDPGLTDPLARMTSNWNLVLKGQLGFNNPQTETGRFSLRNELFRILNGPAGNQRWRDVLSQNVVPNLLALPEFQRHCIPFAPTEPVEPAIVIPFSTTINFGLNFFGWPAGGGDNDYDSTKFATKIRSVGVWFANYNNLGGGMINTPRVYLIPVGMDVMRAPSQGAPYVREWRVLDQALPVPFPLTSSALNNPSYIPIADSLSEDFAAIRRFGRFRAFHDSGNFKVEETINDSRLIGRSVWNSRWLLIIPAGTLHTDRNEGIQRFINGGLKSDGTRDGNGVADIRIFFQTYAYPGN